MGREREGRDKLMKFRALIRLNHSPGPALSEQPGGSAGRRWRTGVLLALIGLHTALMIASAVRNSVTFDEYAHLPAGVAYWRYGWKAFDIHNLSPPLLRLWAAGP